MYKGTGASLIWARRHQVEHWAYLLLTAARAGARVPEVVAAGIGGRREDAVLVVRAPDGSTFGAIEPAAVTDVVLDDVWAELTALAAAQVGKGGVRAADLRLAGDGHVVLDGFSHASYPAPRERSLTDALDFLVVSARIVGVERALGAAMRALGRDGIIELLPVLQPAAVSPRTRTERSADKQLVSQLREQAAAATVGEPPALAEVRRVSITDLLMMIFTPIGFFLIFSELAGLSDVGDVFRSATWGWVIAAFLIAQTPQLASSMSMIGSVMAPLPFGPVFAVQLSNKFTEICGGGVADVALFVRFLQKQGQSAAIAVSSGTLNSVSAGVVQIILVPLCFFASDATFDYSGGDGSAVFKLLIIGVAVVGSVSGFVLLIPRLRHRIFDKLKPQWAAARDNVTQVLTHPRKATELFGGKVLGQILFGMVLYCSVARLRRRPRAPRAHLHQLRRVDHRRRRAGAGWPRCGGGRSDRRAHRGGVELRSGDRGHVHAPAVHVVPPAHHRLVRARVAAQARVHLTGPAITPIVHGGRGRGWPRCPRRSSPGRSGRRAARGSSAPGRRPARA